MDRRTALKLIAGSTVISARGLAEATQQRPLGVALMGLGNYSTTELAPALQLTRFAKLLGIITGSPEKIPEWQKTYSIPDQNVYSYERLDEIANNPEIDIVYNVLPPGLHAEFSIRAAQAGKHVICEKPMAASVAECDAMIEAAKKAGVTLHIGYRLHWDPFHKRMMEVSAGKELGSLKTLDAAFSYRMTTTPPGHWQLSKKLGIAGQLYNLGTYPIQAALYVARENPIRVTATSHNSRPEMFKEVAEGYAWEFEFPSGLKSTGFASGREDRNELSAVAERGSYALDHKAYSYRGIGGHVNGARMDFPTINQQAHQIDGICQSIMNRTASLVPGEMGRRDTILLEAIMRAAETGKSVEIGDLGYPAA